VSEVGIACGAGVALDLIVNHHEDDRDQDAGDGEVCQGDGQREGSLQPGEDLQWDSDEGDSKCHNQHSAEYVVGD
jgi:hypothetical protein